MRFLDTNIFLRHLTGDDPAKHRACVALFRKIGAGRVQVWTTDLAIAEVVFVLSSKEGSGYAFSREQIRDGLLPLLRLPGLQMSTKALYPRIFELYINLNIDFVDAYHAALVEQAEQTELYSYDTDFDRVAGVARLEP